MVLSCLYHTLRVGVGSIFPLTETPVFPSADLPRLRADIITPLSSPTAVSSIEPSASLAETRPNFGPAKPRVAASDPFPNVRTRRPHAPAQPQVFARVCGSRVRCYPSLSRALDPALTPQYLWPSPPFSRFAPASAPLTAVPAPALKPLAHRFADDRRCGPRTVRTPVAPRFRVPRTAGGRPSWRRPIGGHAPGVWSATDLTHTRDDGDELTVPSVAATVAS